LNGSSVPVTDMGRICQAKITRFRRDIGESRDLCRRKPARPQGRMQLFLFGLEVLCNQSG
jgi:hypothetical protein